MTWQPFQSVRVRLWTALALLSFAVITISAATWLTLRRVDASLQELHRQSLSQFAHALELSKRSTDLATSAPYLRNQKLNYLINTEGQKLLTALNGVGSDWPVHEFANDTSNNRVVVEAIDRIATGVQRSYSYLF